MSKNIEPVVPVRGSNFPRSPDEISVEWLNDIMRKAGVASDDEINAIEKETTGSGFGIIGNSARLLLRYRHPTRKAPKSIFVKCSRAESAVRGRFRRSYQCETLFYREIAPLTSVRVPRCYFADLDEESGHSLIILEDPIGVKPGDDFWHYSLHEVESVLRQIASIHAQWWEHPRLRIWNALRAFDGDHTPFVRRYRTNWPRFKEMYGRSAPPSLVEFGERAKGRVGDVRDALASSYSTLGHGDFRADNVLFSQEAGPAVIIDWQMLRRGPGACDVARFIIRSLAVGHRRKIENRLIQTYYSHLVKCGVKNYSLDELTRDLRLAAFHQFFVMVGASLLDRPSERSQRLVKSMIERNNAMLEDHDVWPYIS